MENKKIEIASLKIRIGKKELELTPKECDELYKALHGIFGDEIVKHHHHYDQRWYWPYSQPVVTYAGATTPTYVDNPNSTTVITCAAVPLP